MLKNTPSKPSSVVKRKRKKLIRTGLVPDSSPGSTPTLSARDQLDVIKFARGDQLINAYDKWQKMQGPKMRRQLVPLLAGEGGFGHETVQAVVRKDYRRLGKLFEESPNSGYIKSAMKGLRDATARSIKTDRKSGIFRKKFANMEELARFRLNLSARDQLNSIIQFASSSKFKMTKGQRKDARGRAVSAGIKASIPGGVLGGYLTSITDPESHKRFMMDLHSRYSPPEGLDEHGDLVIRPRKALPFETGEFTEEERLARAAKMEETLSHLKTAKRVGGGVAIGAAILGGIAAHSSYESSKLRARGAKRRADKIKALKTTTMSARDQLTEFKVLNEGRGAAGGAVIGGALTGAGGVAGSLAGTAVAYHRQPVKLSIRPLAEIFAGNATRHGLRSIPVGAVVGGVAGAVIGRNVRKHNERSQQLSARDQLDLIRFKAIDLGRNYGEENTTAWDASSPKTSYPSLYINDRPAELDLPREGMAKVKYKVRNRSMREDDKGKRQHTADIEIHSIDPIEDEDLNEKVKEGEPAKLLSVREHLDEIRFGVGRDFASAAAVGAGTVAGVGGAFATHNAIMRRGGYNAVRKEGIAGLKSLIKKARKKVRLSARDQLSSIINFVADPRSRNLLGEFNGGEAEGPQPAAMQITYGNQARSVGETLGSGAIAGVGGVAAGSAIKALLAKAKNILRK